MPNIGPETCPGFLARFYQFDDALITGVFLRLGRGISNKSARITLDAMDSQSPEALVPVEIVVEELSEFRLTENQVSYQVLDGLFISWFNDLVYLSCGSYEPRSLDDFRSDYYVAGRRASWSVLNSAR